MNDRTHTFSLERIRWSLRLGNIDNAVYVERNVLARSRPMFIAEAVNVFAIMMGGKGMVSIRH
jgi:hypothetical protein